MAIRIGIELDAVDATRTGNVGTSWGDGFGLNSADVRQLAKGITPCGHEPRNVAKPHVLARVALNTCRVRYGYGRGVRNHEGARITAVVEYYAGIRRLDADGAIVNGLVVGYDR